MAKKEIMCAFGTDIDSVAGWIGSYGGADCPPTSSAAYLPAKSASRACCGCSRNMA